MEQFYYEGTAVVENADADCHSLLKASALLRYVEQISTMHARHFGMDDKVQPRAPPWRDFDPLLPLRKGSPRLYQARHHPYGRSRAGSSHGGQPLDHVQP